MVHVAFPVGETSVVPELDVHDVERPGEKIALDIEMTRALLIEP
jgi:hypothetical protein